MHTQKYVIDSNILFDWARVTKISGISWQKLHKYLCEHRVYIFEATIAEAIPKFNYQLRCKLIEFLRVKKLHVIPLKLNYKNFTAKDLIKASPTWSFDRFVSTATQRRVTLESLVANQFASLAALNYAHFLCFVNKRLIMDRPYRLDYLAKSGKFVQSTYRNFDDLLSTGLTKFYKKELDEPINAYLLKQMLMALSFTHIHYLAFVHDIDIKFVNNIFELQDKDKANLEQLILNSPKIRAFLSGNGHPFDKNEIVVLLASLDAIFSGEGDPNLKYSLLYLCELLKDYWQNKRVFKKNDTFDSLFFLLLPKYYLLTRDDKMNKKLQLLLPDNGKVNNEFLKIIEA